ncbi:class I SAM-dependent methyltransferase [candidate division WOR-3 bacterium]|nr:class I SAM-dependent methyltransferase [candidate division WOR-3 bacterium]
MLREPFSRFYRHYDRFMVKYVDYPRWVDYVLRIFAYFRIRPKTMLDLACGTGIPTILLARRGYQLTGVDRSPEMLAVLESKRGDLPIATVRADMREFRTPEPLDAAICLYDSVNYLLTEDDLVRCFRCVRSALAPGGLFVFDMNTVFGLSEQWGTGTTAREAGGVSSIWQNSYDPETRVSTLHLTFWEQPEPGGAGERCEEIHQERGYYPEEVERSLRVGGFGEVHFFQHGSFLPPGPNTTRMMVATRVASTG